MAIPSAAVRRRRWLSPPVPPDRRAASSPGRRAAGALSETDLQTQSAGLIAVVGGPGLHHRCRAGRAGSAACSPHCDGANRSGPRRADPAAPAVAVRAQELFLEMQVHFEREEDRRNLAMLRLASSGSLIASNDTRTATQDGALLCDALDCVRQGVSLRQAGTRASAQRALSEVADRQAALFADMPQALTNTVEIATRCRFRHGLSLSRLSSPRSAARQRRTDRASRAACVSAARVFELPPPLCPLHRPRPRSV